MLRLHRYSIHTERSYIEWIRRFARFHGMRSRADLFPAEPEIEGFLTDLAVHGNVAAAGSEVSECRIEDVALGFPLLHFHFNLAYGLSNGSFQERSNA